LSESKSDPFWFFFLVFSSEKEYFFDHETAAAVRLMIYHSFVRYFFFTPLTTTFTRSNTYSLSSTHNVNTSRTHTVNRHIRATTLAHTLRRTHNMHNLYKVKFHFRTLARSLRRADDTHQNLPFCYVLQRFQDQLNKGDILFVTHTTNAYATWSKRDQP
jgi:hypothetical protein